MSRKTRCQIEGDDITFRRPRNVISARASGEVVGSILAVGVMGGDEAAQGVVGVALGGVGDAGTHFAFNPAGFNEQVDLAAVGQ